MCESVTTHTQQRDMKFVTIMKILPRKIKTDESTVKNMFLQAGFEEEIRTF